MFSSSFREGSKEEIPLPEKKLSHFVLFLRSLAPGFDDECSSRYTNRSIIWSSGQQYCNADDTVHDMLIADEYQTDDLKKKIEKFLVKGALTKSDSITSEQIIIDILEAEMYKLSDYLTASIAIASRKKFHRLTKSPKFEEISQTTQRKISFKRWEDIDNVFNKAVQISPQLNQYQINKLPQYSQPCGLFEIPTATPLAPKQYEIDIKDAGNQLKPYMKDN